LVELQMANNEKMMAELEAKAELEQKIEELERK
jgi:hypothetical protein